MIALWIVLGVVALILLWAVAAFNRFVRQRQTIRNAFADIDTELKRRHDLIPNLVESVKGYASHERETFEEVTRARARAMEAQGPAAQAQAEDVLSRALGRLFAVAEQYPALRATENFQQLQAELSNTENRIQTSRSVYNDTVRSYNERVQSVPSNVIARMFNFDLEEFFEIGEAERAEAERAPEVDFTGRGGAAAPAGGGQGGGAPSGGAPSGGGSGQA